MSDRQSVYARVRNIGDDGLVRLFNYYVYGAGDGDGTVDSDNTGDGGWVTSSNI